MTYALVLSHYQASDLVRARNEMRAQVRVSLDLGLSTSQVLLETDRVLLSDGQWLSWDIVEEIAGNESVCYAVEENDAFKVQRFSETLNRFYSLMPTEGAPTILISGVLMHRIKGIDPHRDTLRKVRTIAPLAGRVLDTCTGLGYTAIEAAKTAEQVTSIELDPAVLEVASVNPWSRALFGNPRIEQVIGDTFDEIQEFEAESFARIIHDPPVFSLAGDLYSGECYRHLHRILNRRGRLYHYVGDPESRSGRNVTKGVVRRLQEAGFRRVVRKPGAFGLVGFK